MTHEAGAEYSRRGRAIGAGEARITYTLTSLTLKEQPREPNEPFVCEAAGSLVVAGETNSFTMPVAVTPTPDGKVRFAGLARLKMSDFKITPPAPAIAGGAIKTGDAVTLSFVWWVNRATSMASGR
jgi:hypothetical protein